MAPSPKNFTKKRSLAAKTKPYFVVSLDLGTTKAFDLRLVWLDFRSQRCSP
jgi:hypothetical protein